MNPGNAMTFEIESQSGQNISNIGGDQKIYYGDRSRAARLGKVLAALGLLLSLAGLAVLIAVGMTTARSVVFTPRTPAECRRRTPSTCLRAGPPRPCSSWAASSSTASRGSWWGDDDVQHRQPERRLDPERRRRYGDPGRDPGTATVNVAELQGRLADVRQEIDRVALPARSRAVAMQALADAEAEAAAPAPRPSRIAQSLRRVTETLQDAGVLASAAVGAVRALGGALSLVALLA